MTRDEAYKQVEKVVRALDEAEDEFYKVTKGIDLTPEYANKEFHEAIDLLDAIAKANRQIRDFGRKVRGNE